jgi:hypothetical protein
MDEWIYSREKYCRKIKRFHATNATEFFSFRCIAYIRSNRREKQEINSELDVQECDVTTAKSGF